MRGFLLRQAQLPESLQGGRGRTSSRARRQITADGALRQSTIWACSTLRADLISNFPIDVYRRLGSMQVEVEKPPILVKPSGELSGIREWMYSSQMDLDLVGNCYGIITEVDGNGKPRRIDLVSHADVTVRVKDGVVTYWIKGKKYDADQIWHERQYTLPGHVMGLSPIAYAAWSLELWASAQEFGLDWFSNNGQIPYGHLRNTAKTIDPREAEKVKERYKLSIEGDDIFVTGNDWQFSTVNAPAADAKFLESQNYSDRDAVRFMGVPGDLVDVSDKGSSITYANITERNLQFLIMKLGPATGRREESLGRLVADPRFVKLNTDAILRMDPMAVTKKLIAEVQARLRTPTEARALMNLAPMTDAQWAEFDHLPAATNQSATIGDKA